MNADAVHHYRLLKSALLAEFRRALAAYVPAFFFILAAGMIISLLLGIRHGYDRQTTIIMAVVTAVYIAYIAFAMPRKLRKRLAKCWDTYDLEIGPDYFLRRQADTPDLHLKFDEITKVERFPGRYLRVIGNRKQHVIGIPEGIENLEEVLRAVSAAHPVTLRSGEFGRSRILYMAGGAAAFLTMLWSKSIFLATLLAIGLSATILWAVWSVQRSPNASRQTRRASWWYLLVLIPCVAKIFESLGYLLRR